MTDPEFGYFISGERDKNGKKKEFPDYNLEEIKKYLKKLISM